MLGQLNFDGKDKVEVAIQRFKTFEPPEGYYLAFSGGKDSCVIKALADMAGVKYDAHYNVTSVDPPELIYFIREHHPDVVFERERYKDGTPKTMWNLIPKMGMPPTRIVRYCCAELKEHGGEGRFRVTGVRQAESVKRSHRGGLELADRKSDKKRIKYDVDNAEEHLIRMCMQKAQRILNPIIDWSDEDVWEFIKKYDIPYCKLYDEGWKRIGCIGCPMQNPKGRLLELERYPKFKEAYIRAFDRMLKNHPSPNGEVDGKERYEYWTKGEVPPKYSRNFATRKRQMRVPWTSGGAVMSWWIK